MTQRLRSVQDGNIKNLMSNTIECIYKRIWLFIISTSFF